MQKRWLSLVILLIILLNGVSCSAASARDFIRFLEDPEPVEYSAQILFEKLPQFSEERTEKLNRLMKHFHFSGILSEAESTLKASLDDQDLFSYTETMHGEKKHAVLSTAPEHEAVLPDSFFQTLSGGGDSAGMNPGILRRSLTIHQSLQAFRDFFQQMPSLFPANATSVKIREKYRDYGSAAEKVSVVLSAEELIQFLSEYGLKKGNVFYPDLSSMVFEGKQSFALLFTEEDQLIKVNYSGKAGFSPEDIRTVRIDWKTVRTQNLEKDELLLKTPNTQQNKRDNYILSCSWKLNEDQSEEFLWSAETDHVGGGIRTRTFDECSLVSAEKKIEGSFSETVKSGGQNSSSEYLLSAEETGSDSCLGTLEIINKKDTIEKQHFFLQFGFSPASHQPVSSFEPETEAVTEDSIPGFLSFLNSRILQSVVTLPEEDLLFLKEGIPDDQWNSLFAEENH